VTGGAPPPRQGWRWRAPAQDEKAKAMHLFAAGATAPAAKALGVSRATAYRWLAEHRAGRGGETAPRPTAEAVRQPASEAEQEWAMRLTMAGARR
jgi:hypothetical protein